MGCNHSCRKYLHASAKKKLFGDQLFKYRCRNVGCFIEVLCRLARRFGRFHGRSLCRLLFESLHSLLSNFGLFIQSKSSNLFFINIASMIPPLLSSQKRGLTLLGRHCRVALLKILFHRE